jgi:hypothetical protein
MEEKVREINLEDLKKYQHNGFSTVGDLLEYIHGKIASGEITRDSLVLSQRIEDKYFEENNFKEISNSDKSSCNLTILSLIPSTFTNSLFSLINVFKSLTVLKYSLKSKLSFFVTIFYYC